MRSRSVLNTRRSLRRMHPLLKDSLGRTHLKAHLCYVLRQPHRRLTLSDAAKAHQKCTLHKSTIGKDTRHPPKKNVAHTIANGIANGICRAK